MDKKNDLKFFLDELIGIKKEELQVEVLLVFIAKLLVRIDSINLNNYKELILITEHLADLINYFIEKNSPIVINDIFVEYIKSELFTSLFLFISLSDVYTVLSIKILELGLPGLAYDYISLAEDPTYDKTKSTVHDANKIIFNRQIYFRMILLTKYDNDQYREKYFKKEITHLRLRLIIGDIRDESLIAVKFNYDLLKFGEEARYYDIQYLCNLMHIISKKDYKDFATKGLYQQIYSILNDQLKIEIKRKSKEAFEISYFLALVTNKLKHINQAIKLGDKESYKLMTVKLKKYIHQHSFSISSAKLLFKNFLRKAFDVSRETEKENYDILLNIQKYLNGEFISALVFECFSKGHLREAIEFSYLWLIAKEERDLELELSSEAVILLVIPNIKGKGADQVGYLLFDGQTIKKIITAPKIKLSKLMEMSDQVQAKWHVILEDKESLHKTGESDYIVNTTDDINASYYSCLLEYFQPELLKSDLQMINPEKSIKVIETTWLNEPLVPLLEQELDRKFSITISKSFEDSNHSFSRIDKVLIWCDPDESLYFSVKEKEALLYLLDQQNVQYDIYEGAACNKELFLERFTDDSYNVIWLICHGEFNSNNPLDSKLIIEKDNPIFIQELTAYKSKRIDKRLIVLNACQSTASTVRYNSSISLGIGSLLTNEYQIVIGHLWPTNFMASTIWGSLIMQNLLKMKSWDTALFDSRKTILTGNLEIRNQLMQIGPVSDLIKEDTKEDYKKTVYSLSSIMYM